MYIGAIARAHRLFLNHSPDAYTFHIHVFANRIDQDQTAPVGADWSGSTMFSSNTEHCCTDFNLLTH